MHLKCRLPLVFFFTLFVLVVSVDAAHGNSPAHARRSLAFKKKLHRQLNVGIPGVLGDAVDDLLGGGSTSTPDPSSTSTPPLDATFPPITDPPILPLNTDPPPSTSSSTTTTSSPSDTPSTNPPSSDTSSSSPTTDTPTPTPPPTNPGSPSPSSSSSTPSPDTTTCPLGLDLLGNCILPPPPTSPPADSSNSEPTLTTSTPPPSSVSSQTTDSPSPPPTDPPTSPPQKSTPTPSSPPAPSLETPTPTLDCPLGLVVNGECVIPSSSSLSTPPAGPSNLPSTPLSTPPPATTPNPGQSSSSSSPTTPNPESPSSPTPTPASPPADPCGPVGRLLGLCTSNSSPPATTPPSTPTPPTPPLTNPPESSSPSTPSPTSTPSPPVDPCGSAGIALGLCASSPSPPSTPSPTSTPSPPADPCGSVGIALGLCTSPPLPPGSSGTSSTITSPEPCAPYQQALGLCGSTTTPNPGTQTSSGTIPSSGTYSLPPGTQSGPSPSGQSSLTTSLPTGFPTTWSGTTSNTTPGSLNDTSTSSPPVIAFPSGTNNTVSPTTSFSSTTTSDTSPPLFTPPPQTQLSYITQTSLLGAPVPSSSSISQSDPDALPITLSNASPSNPPSTTPPILLPSNLPARIYPPTQVDPNSLSGFSLVSILFDQFLAWAFVAQNTQSQGQLFLWLPTIIQSALGLPSDQVRSFALQVYVPAAYSGPGDVDLLLTTFLLYIPSDQVPVLANQIKVVSSPFYTSLGDPYRNLASHVNPAFAVNSVQDPNAVPGTTSSASSSGNKSRTDAIIGVASTLGGLALVVLGVLIYRSVKRSRDLRHRRLSEPNAPNVPYPDRAGRDFDQDSVGGQRRRSFYFAEDSLRGQQTVQQTAVPVAQPQGQHVMQPVSQAEYSYRTSPDGVRERRAPVVTGAISAPILTQSSLNW